VHYLLQIGRQPRLSVAEIHALLPAARIAATGHKQFAQLTGAVVSANDFYQLGGAVRLATVFATDLAESDAVCAAIATQLRELQPTGKIKFAIASFAPSPLDNKTLAMGVKQLLKADERSCRFLNRQWRHLDAGTLHNESCVASVDGDKPQKNWEILLVPQRAGGVTLALTTAAQDINDWARRDVGKPVRDMQVGMLPAKLARMLVNLARDADGALPVAVWDCCCGTGTVLLEAQALGVTAIFASDISDKMVTATTENLAYFNADGAQVWLHDVTASLDCELPAKTVIVSEGYLGQICQRPLSAAELAARRAEVLPVYRGILWQTTAVRIVLC